MVIRDTPSDLEKYFMADGELAFGIQQAGIKPSHIDEGAVYFKKSNRLKKLLKRLGVS
jgi:hypothetical protein